MRFRRLLIVTDSNRWQSQGASGWAHGVKVCQCTFLWGNSAAYWQQWSMHAESCLRINRHPCDASLYRSHKRGMLPVVLQNRQIWILGRRSVPKLTSLRLVQWSCCTMARAWWRKWCLAVSHPLPRATADGRLLFTITERNEDVSTNSKQQLWGIVCVSYMLRFSGTVALCV